MKLKAVRVKIIENISASDLEADIVAWLATQTEAELVSLQYIVDGGNYSVVILYGQ